MGVRSACRELQAGVHAVRRRVPCVRDASTVTFPVKRPLPILGSTARAHILSGPACKVPISKGGLSAASQVS
jgi:hypothetical protein